MSKHSMRLGALRRCSALAQLLEHALALRALVAALGVAVARVGRAPSRRRRSLAPRCGQQDLDLSALALAEILGAHSASSSASGRTIASGIGRSP